MDGVMYLAISFRLNGTLSRLGLAHVGMEDEGACHIASHLTENKKLTHIDLSGNNIGMEGSQQVLIIVLLFFILCSWSMH
jgi:Ran GTPase-activating protein (RanGAP) involved in mRNA processing and transport